MTQKFKPATLCVQAGWQPKNGESRVLPIIQSTTFKYDNTEEMADLFDLKKDGYFYTRLANPTNDAVAQKIAALEGGVGAVLTSSGQAANFYAIFNICEAGDHIVTSNEIYGSWASSAPSSLKKPAKKKSTRHSVLTPRHCLVRPSAILAVRFSTSRSSHASLTSTVSPSSSIIPSQHQSTVVPSSGAQTSSPTLPRSIWMATPHRLVVPS